MADKYYAWSTFTVPNNDPSKKVIVINPGDEVTTTTLAVDKDEFDILVAEGAVRTAKWPVPPEAGTVSPIEHLRQKAAETAEKGIDAVIEELSAATKPPEPAP